MKDITINRLVYTEIRSLGNYENLRMEAEALVSPESDPRMTAKRLRFWVRDQIEAALEELEESENE